MSIGQPIRHAATAATGGLDAHRFAATRAGALVLVAIAGAIVLLVFHGLGQFQVDGGQPGELSEQNVSRDYAYEPPVGDRKAPERRRVRRERAPEPAVPARVERAASRQSVRPLPVRTADRPQVRPVAKPVRAPVPVRPVKQRQPKAPPATGGTRELLNDVRAPVGPLPGGLDSTLDETTKPVEGPAEQVVTMPGSPLSELGITAPVPLP